jgi:hypothetical protein
VAAMIQVYACRLNGVSPKVLPHSLSLTRPFDLSIHVARFAAAQFASRRCDNFNDPSPSAA